MKRRKSHFKALYLVLVIFLGGHIALKASGPENLQKQLESHQHLDSLFHKLVSSIRFTDDGKVVAHGNSPVKLYVNNKSIPLLYQPDTIFENIELMVCF